MSTTTVEFHWAGTDGTCRNLGKFGLIANKVVFSFPYDSIAFVSGLMTTYSYKGVTLTLSANQQQELVVFAVINSQVDPFTPEASIYAAQAKESARRAAESQAFATLSQDQSAQSAVIAATSSAASVTSAQSAKSSETAAKAAEVAIMTLYDYVGTNWFHPPVVYAAGLSVTDGKFTVSNSGTLYFADPSKTPFTTGAFDATQWFKFQSLDDAPPPTTPILGIKPIKFSPTVVAAGTGQPTAFTASIAESYSDHRDYFSSTIGHLKVTSKNSGTGVVILQNALNKISLKATAVSISIAMNVQIASNYMGPISGLTAAGSRHVMLYKVATDGTLIPLQASEVSNTFEFHYSVTYLTKET